jgi:hypothetical protein
MVDSTPYPDRKLSKEETSERKQLIEGEHTKLHNEWKQAGGQQIFDVGRLASPMWQAYRRNYKARAKANKKVPWESKWVHPEAFKQTQYDFLNIPAEPHIIDKYLENEDSTVEKTDLKGLSGTHPVILWSICKQYGANVKHSSKFDYLSKEQRNFLVMNPAFARAVTEDDSDECNRFWHAQVRDWKKSPWDFHQIFLPSQMPGHAILVVFTFENGCNIEFWDSGHGNWSKWFEHAKNWLTGYYEYKEKVSMVDHKDEIPLQTDPFNCAQWTILACKALMRGEKPHYSEFVANPKEDALANQPGRKFKVGRRTWYGAKVHPETDRVVEKFSKIKEKDYHRMKKWQTKQMKGFK